MIDLKLLGGFDFGLTDWRTNGHLYFLSRFRDWKYCNFWKFNVQFCGRFLIFSPCNGADLFSICRITTLDDFHDFYHNLYTGHKVQKWGETFLKVKTQLRYSSFKLSSKIMEWIFFPFILKLHYLWSVLTYRGVPPHFVNLRSRTFI